MFKFNPTTGKFDLVKNSWLLNGNTLSSKKTFGSIDDQDIGFITNNTERLTILKGGNIGIGMTNPSAKLQVAGNITSSDNVHINKDYARIILGQVGADGDVSFGSSGNAVLTNGWQDYGFYAAYNAYRGDDGNWYHTRTTTVNAFKFTGGQHQAGFTWSYSPNVGTSTIAWTDLMRLTSAGYLGIGTINPSSILTVNGPVETGRAGILGNYYSTQVQGVWSIGNGYQISTVNNNFGSQYGLVYAHTDASSVGTSKGPISGWGHQILFTSAGDYKAAISLSYGHAYFSGNVGIGTTTPGEALWIEKPTASRLVITNGSWPLQAGSDSVVGAHFGLRGQKGIAFEASGNLIPINISSTGVTSYPDNNSSLGRSTIRWGSLFVNGLTATGGNVGIGTTNPGSKLHVVNANGQATLTLESTYNAAGGRSDILLKSLFGDTMLRFDADTSGGYIQAGNYNFTGNRPLYFSGYNGNQGSNVDFNFATSYFSGNVGIGTTNPTVALDVSSSALNAPATSGTTNNGFMRVGYTPRTWAGSELNMGIINSNPYPFWLQAQNPADLSVSRPLVFNPNGGNVGIGTTVPSGRLELGTNGTDVDNSLIIQSGTTAGKTGSLLFKASNTSPGDTYKKAGIIFERTAADGRGSLHFAVDNTADSSNVDLADAKITILPSGNVGVGITNPTQKLSIKDNGTVTNGQYTFGVHTDDQAVYNAGFFNDTYSIATPVFEYFGWNNGEFSMGTKDAKNLYFYTGGYTNNRLTITGTGNVGIGTTAPLGKLHTVNSDITKYAGYFYTDTAGNAENATLLVNQASSAAADKILRIRSNAVDRFVIQGDGNVGIGTTAPGEKLEVNGNIKVSGNMLKMTGISTATRDGLTAVAGDIIYNTTTNKHQGYNGSTWNDLY